MTLLRTTPVYPRDAAVELIERLRDVLKLADTSINPADIDGISLEKWQVRLKNATQEIRYSILQANDFLSKGRAP